MQLFWIIKTLGKSRTLNEGGASLVQLMVISSIVVATGMALLQMTESIVKRQKVFADEDAFRSVMDEISLALSVQTSTHLCKSALQVDPSTPSFGNDRVRLTGIQWPGGGSIISVGGGVRNALNWTVGSILVEVGTRMTDRLIAGETIQAASASITVTFNRLSERSVLGSSRVSRSLPITVLYQDSLGGTLYDCYSNKSEAFACYYFFGGNFNDSGPSPKCRISSVISDGGLGLRAGDPGSLTGIFIQGDGSIGIGTSTPTVALHAVGKIQIDGNVTVKGNFVSGGDVAVTGSPGTALFVGLGQVQEDLTVNGKLNIEGNFEQTGSSAQLTSSKKLLVQNRATLSQGMTASGAVSFKNLSVSGQYRGARLLATSDVFASTSIHANNVRAQRAIQAGTCQNPLIPSPPSINLSGAGQCPAGQLAQGIQSNGQLLCSAPNLYPGATCAPGEFVQAMDSDGTVKCAAESNPIAQTSNCAINQIPRWNASVRPARWDCQPIPTLPGGYYFDCKDLPARREQWTDPSKTCDYNKWTPNQSTGCSNGCTAAVGSEVRDDHGNSVPGSPIPCSKPDPSNPGHFIVTSCSDSYTYRSQNWCWELSGDDTCRTAGEDFKCVAVVDHKGIGNYASTCSFRMPTMPGGIAGGVSQDVVRCCRILKSS